jgi:hypothetical protein
VHGNEAAALPTPENCVREGILTGELAPGAVGETNRASERRETLFSHVLITARASALNGRCAAAATRQRHSASCAANNGMEVAREAPGYREVPTWDNAAAASEAAGKLL